MDDSGSSPWIRHGAAKGEAGLTMLDLSRRSPWGEAGCWIERSFASLPQNTQMNTDDIATSPSADGPQMTQIDADSIADENGFPTFNADAVLPVPLRCYKVRSLSFLARKPCYTLEKCLD